MNLQRLEGFYWVAKTQGYARAARAFPYPITQPGVHQQVRRLEEELGVKLFERAGKDRVMLTPQGQVLFQAIAGFMEQLPEVEARVKGGVVGGTLKLAAAGHVLRHLVPDWLRKLYTQRPDISVSLTELPATDLELLRRGETDVIVDWVDHVPPDLDSRVVGMVRGWIVAPTHGPWAQEGTLTLQKLEHVPFIAYHADKTLKELQREALRHFGVAPREAFAADSSDTIVGFVAAGLGFSLIPSVLPTGPRAAGIIASPLDHPTAVFPVVAAWKKRTQPNSLITAALNAAPVVDVSTLPPGALARSGSARRQLRSSAQRRLESR